MPRGDGMGPMGMGPMTGRGGGYCAGFGRPGFMNSPGWGMPYGRFAGGRGMGRRFFGAGYGGPMGWGFCPPYYAVGLGADEEKAVLARQMEAVEGRLADLRRRLSELESEKESGQP